MTCSLTASTTPLPTAVTVNDVCDRLTDFLNVLTGIVPVTIHFPAGSDLDGIEHPAGLLSLDPSSKRATNCTALSLSSVLAVQLSFSDKLIVSIPEFNATIESCEVKLHYRVSRVSDRTSLKAVLAEVSSLGKVTLQNGTDYSTEADELIRPVLFLALSKFCKEQLSFTINSKAKDTNVDTLSAFQFVLKRTVLGLLNVPSNGNATKTELINEN